MSRTKNVDVITGELTTGKACHADPHAKNSRPFMAQVMAEFTRLLGQRELAYKNAARNLANTARDQAELDQGIRDLATRSITGNIPRNDLKGDLATTVQTWAVIGYPGADTVAYYLSEISLDIVLSTGGHDGGDDLITCTPTANPLGDGMPIVNLTTPKSDGTAYIRSCGCVGTARGYVGSATAMALVADSETGKFADYLCSLTPSQVVATRLLAHVDRLRNAITGQTLDTAKSVCGYQSQHDPSIRVATYQGRDIRAKY